MRKIFLLPFLAVAANGFGQCPTVPIDLLDQSEVNAFPVNYPGCTFLPDGVDLKISGSDITDLSPLMPLTGSDAIIEVRNCPLLASLNGFDNMTRIGNTIADGFILRDLPSLTDMNALSNLDTVNGELTIRSCSGLVNLNGLDHLVYANGTVIIRDNGSLTSLNGFDSLSYIGETLELVGNAVLTNIQGLQHVDTIVGGIEGGIFIEGNTLLSSLTGLGNDSTHIGSDLYLALNGNLELCSVPSVCHYLSNPPAGATITINSNSVGCNSQTEVETSCLNVGIFENIPGPVELFIVQSNIVHEQVVVFTNKNCMIQIFDVQGRSYSYALQQGRNEINLHAFSNGLLFISNSHGGVLKMLKQ